MPLRHNIPHLLASVNWYADILRCFHSVLVEIKTQEDIATIEEVSVLIYNACIIE